MGMGIQILIHGTGMGGNGILIVLPHTSGSE